MNVAEFIEVLREFPADADVEVLDYIGQGGPPVAVKVPRDEPTVLIATAEQAETMRRARMGVPAETAADRAGGALGLGAAPPKPEGAQLELLDGEAVLLVDRKTGRATLTVAGARAIIKQHKESYPFLTDKQAEARALWQHELSDAHIGRILGISASSVRSRRLAADRREEAEARWASLPAEVRGFLEDEEPSGDERYQRDTAEIGHLDPDASEPGDEAS